MANGDIQKLDVREFRALLLDGQSASHSGVWVEIPPGLDNKTIESSDLEEGATDATVALMVKNDETKPLDATDGITLATLTTTVLGASDQGGWRWLKAKKTAGTTPVGTTVTLVARRFK